MTLAASTSESHQEFRRQMPVAQKWAYLDHAAVAPLPQPTCDTIAAILSESATEGDTVWPEWARRVEQIRSTAAQMIAAEPEEMAFVANTTTGIGMVAEGLEFVDGDNIVTLANEFPSNQYPWFNLESRGVETRRVPVENGVPDLSQIAAACDSRTRLISVSWVGFASGYRLNVAEVAQIARDNGAKFFLDAIQGFGVFPLDVRRDGVDFLAADGHKWMLGPEGAGLLFVRRELLNSLRPIGVGWNSVKQGSDYDRVELNVRDDAARYEGGSPNMLGIHGLGKSLDLLAAQGVGPTSSPVADRIMDLSNYAAEAITNAGGQLISPHVDGHTSGILTARFDHADNGTLRKACYAANVAVSARGGGIRISPHFYNNEDDIHRFVEAVTAS